ncbi:MAG: peptidyl-prolyl cis-trans isomerase [Desulfobacterales bacterium]|nr:peptidyl-prolyl cis-trans isomerase [Desulfobacterales bacterium]
MLRTRNVIFLGMVMIAAGIFSQAGAEVVDRIVAVVNNEIITLSELNKATAMYKSKIQASQNSEARKKEMIAELETEMLNKLVDASLTIQEAVKYGIKVTDKDVDTALENFKKQNKLDDEALKQGLAAAGRTVEDYREQMKEQILQSMLVNRAVRSKVIITDADIQTYYDAHKDDFSGVKKYRLKNILTPSSEEIEKIEKQLQKNASFSALAKEYSIGSNASQGGDLGLFDISSFSEEIRTALADLKKGEHTPVIQTGSAYQIIYVDDVVMEGQLTMDQAQDKIRDILYKDQVETQFKAWIQSLKESAHIELML